MNRWIKGLLSLKFDPQIIKAGNALNAFNYLLNPINEINILSEVHRKQIAKNILQLPYDRENFTTDLVSYFAPYLTTLKNEKNRTHLITRILYTYKYKWLKDEAESAVLEETLFKIWLQENHKQISKPEKYVGTIRTISNDLKSITDIQDLFQINKVSELQELKSLYFNTPVFETKNTRGNRMYSRAFNLYIEYASSDDVSKDILNIIRSEQKDTEKEALILARVGQGKFRNDLIQFWKGCSISGYNDTSLLIASHIKPWSKSNNNERIDPYNGLLLLPNYDKLFDKGLISFDDNGQIVISDLFTRQEVFGINDHLNIELKEKNKKYLKYHREHVFKTQS